MEEITYKQLYDAPIGKMIIVSDGEAIIEIDHVNNDEPITSNPDELCQLATKQLDEYFAGQRTEFDLPLKAIKGTDFQKAAWQALTSIPYGETISYSEQAKRMDNPKAVRAVGGANSKNPFSIVVPCHRVIGANGTLTGYTGGMNRKEWLLDFERSVLDKTQ
ncbi:methylated-DNA--[protein]-cysteine S-methyltransferase [Vibrio sp. Isolate31]|uniref:methylated-DNA--[protein]-cysteine S-methyltransferase n=1 Tax=unclassified Vibrio TaxID=2614977 RepID=UPI001EFD22F2|nr:MULTISPECIES: methylated-DNA--[protein]-cysteine S-methyltransferase [unclassified Vibrio]MCG9553868.1 methylated-DNA--[protein]-cysteine S-methyltransferase [Vibrio sp. Isolate32]MCG9599645.1 methylated-DNA--[protein]-cysteine S-methyltransferase [Vibrio sp. Isolate31]